MANAEDCPHCGTRVVLETRQNWWVFVEGDGEGEGVDIQISQCPNWDCRKFVFDKQWWHEYGPGANDKAIDRTERIFPLGPRSLSQEIPEDIRNDYAGARACALLSPDGAAA